MSQQLDRLEVTVPVSPSGSHEKRAERRDAAENRMRVLIVARQLFDEHGVESVSMHQIAQAAGVGQGTLYRRYPHKGELCRDMMSETFESFRAETEQYLAENAGIPALERLNCLLGRYLDVMDTKTSLLAAIDDSCGGQRRVEKFQTTGYQWAHGTLSTLLAEAVSNGELRPIDPSFTADTILAASSVDVYQFQRDVRGLSRDEILQNLRRIFA
jgi:AcrR family transcriptional regulator